MKLPKLILIPLTLGLWGCASLGFNTVTSQQAVAIAQPIISGSLTLVLANNPSYIPLAQKVGSDLATANWTDLTLTGINSAVQAAVAREGGSQALGAIISSSLDAGLAGYLEAVGEAALAKDPNAQAVLQALGTAIVNGASAAAAIPPKNT